MDTSSWIPAKASFEWKVRYHYEMQLINFFKGER